MLELTGEHIQKLGDEDLRELVRRLCDAELRRNGFPASAVTAGGNQTAPDGGIDVRVEAPAGAVLDFIKRPNTGFQVKCEDMPAAKIKSEMCPAGVLRPAIRELIALGGAYIIVSSKGSVADGPLRSRRQAMEAAIKGQPDHSKLLIDVYDRDRLAAWVSSYPGVEMWVRERTHVRLEGWYAYGNWSNASVSGDYLTDDAGRVFAKTSGSPEAMSAANGIDAIREKLSKPGGIVRLIGLSGTGKTRLVQALFEPGVGASEVLDKATAIYTDQGHSPQPSAREMLMRLGAQAKRAIVVVDNCNPDTHRALTDIVGRNTEHLSLMTVEYDVADDEPEATDVYELAASSDSVLIQILGRLASHVEQGDRTRIAEFSGGNARVALALAQTLKKGETLGVLNDDKLLERLFRQNNAPDAALWRSAKACSLVYSFDVKDTESSASELKVLASLAGLSVDELYRHVAELKRRDIVQSRSRWRAVLPHALANRLAKLALEELPPDRITNAFVSHERLLRSFSRRLGYLHDCPEACAIAEKWFDEDGYLGKPASFNELGQTLFFNLASLIPAKALQVIERTVQSEQGEAFTSSNFPSRDRWISLTRSLAYEAGHFNNAARIILRYAEAGDSNGHVDEDAWKELFYVALSGTQAPAQLRLALLRDLLMTGSARQCALALKGLDAMLETRLTSSHNFEFGARPRNYGWQPSSDQDFTNWYGSVFLLVMELAKPGCPHRNIVRKSVANHFRELLEMNAETQSAVIELLRFTAGSDGWSDGWIATRLTLRFDSSSLSQELLEKLQTLEKELRPKTLRQEVFAYVFSQPFGSLDIAYGEDSDDEMEDSNPVPAHERVALRVQGLGIKVGADKQLLEELLPQLLSDGPGQRGHFGKGIGLAGGDSLACWVQFYSVYEKLEPASRNIEFLRGFLEGVGMVNKAAANNILDSLVVDPLLAEHFPFLQGYANDDIAARRLLKSIEYSVAPARSFYHAAMRRRDHEMSTEMYVKVVQQLAKMPKGLEVAIDSVRMEIHIHRSEVAKIPNEIIALGRELLISFDFAERDNNVAYHLDELAKVCLLGSDGAVAADAFCRHFAESLRVIKSHAGDFRKLACTMFKLQPNAALNAFVGEELTPLGYPLLSRFGLSKSSVVNCAESSALLDWVKQDVGVRAPLLAAEVDIFVKTDKGNFTWSPVAVGLLSMSTDRAAVLGGFEGRFRPRAWSGGLQEALQPYIEMTEKLCLDNDPIVADWALSHLTSMRSRIAARINVERRQDESFE